MALSAFKNRTLPYAVVGLFVLVGLVLFATSKGCGRQSGFPVACYPQFIYILAPSNRVLATPGVAYSEQCSIRGIAPIYVQIAGNDIIYLPDLTLERTREMSKELGWQEYTVMDPENWTT